MLRIEDRDVSMSNLTAPTEKSHYEFFVTVIRQPLSAGHDGFCNNFANNFGTQYSLALFMLIMCW